MEIAKLTLLGSSAILGIGAPMTTSAYFSTHVTIWDEIKEDAIPTSLTNTELWDKLKSKIPSDPKDKELKSIKQDSSDQKEKLKKWCFNKYKETYSRFGYILNKDLLSEAKAVCILKIQDKMEASVRLSATGEEGQSQYKTHLSTLKTYNESPLDKDLSNLQAKVKKNDSDEKNWQELRDWCGKAYDRGYQGDNSNLWKLVQKFCKK